MESQIFPRIAARYLLVINVPLYRGESGLCAGQLWFKDLAEHLVYLENFAVACPVADGTPPDGPVALASDHRFGRIAINPLPLPNGMLRTLVSAPRIAIDLWLAIRQTDIVHIGVAGWPIPYGWIATPIARILRKKLVVIVESAPWRLTVGLPRNMKARVRAQVFEQMARWCVRSADLAIFTQDEYRRTLPPRNPERGHVIHASWIDEESIITDTEAERLWRTKLDVNSGRVSLVFVGRLDAQKGVVVLLHAIRLLAAKELNVTVDIVGNGELLPMCCKLRDELHGKTRVNVLGTVSYGASLFSLLRQYHALVIPSISDEQPRILYDAYSQAIPVLGTRTAGLRDCIDEGVTGWLVAPNDPAALAAMLERSSNELRSLSRMGMAALGVARTMTHQKMHRERQRLLIQLTAATTTS